MCLHLREIWSVLLHAVYCLIRRWWRLPRVWKLRTALNVERLDTVLDAQAAIGVFVYQVLRPSTRDPCKTRLDPPPA